MRPAHGVGACSHPHPAGFGSCSSLSGTWTSNLSLPMGSPAFQDSAWCRLFCQALATSLSFLNRCYSTCPDVCVGLPITFLSHSYWEASVPPLLVLPAMVRWGVHARI